MKRIVALLSVFIFIISLNLSFADTFTVKEVSPKDGEKNILASSFMMKITFSEDVLVEGNEEYFKLIDEKDNSVAIDVIQGTEPNRIDIKTDKYLESGQSYVLQIDPSVKSVSGNVLAEKYTSSFSTSKLKTNLGFKGIIIMFGILAASGFILQFSKKKMDKVRNERKEKEKREMKKLEKKEKKERQRQKYENKDDKK